MYDRCAMRYYRILCTSQTVVLFLVYTWWLVRWIVELMIVVVIYLDLRAREAMQKCVYIISVTYLLFTKALDIGNPRNV